MVIVRTVIAIAAIRNWPLYHMKVHKAFLQGDLNEDVYMTIPQGYSNQEETKACRVLTPLYGFIEALITTGLIQT